MNKIPEKKKLNTIYILKNILIIITIVSICIATGLSIYNKILDQKKINNIDSYLKEIAGRITKSNLETHKFQLNNGQNGFYYTTEHGETLLFTNYFAPYITGYGGPIEILVSIDKKNCIQKIHLVKHNETPQWIDKISGWLKAMKGKILINTEPLNNIDTVSGATYSSKAILKILKKTGSGFYKIQNNETTGINNNNKQTFKFTLPCFILFIFLVSAVFLRNIPDKILRLVFMMIIVIISGFFLNLQLSSYHILTIIQSSVFINGFDKNLFFFILLPLKILFLGNIYCGYLCPFGLLQELVHEIFFFINIKIPQKIEPVLRLIKYIFLILIILSPVLSILKPVTRMDILLSAFNFSSYAILFSVIGMLILSAVFNRFWCKYLCPTGAFLSIIHGISFFLYKNLFKKIPVFKKLYHIPHINKCDLGIKKITDNNCICCDRCRYRNYNLSYVSIIKNSAKKIKNLYSKLLKNR